NITVSNDANACDADVTVPAPVYVDECGIATVVNDYNGGADASDNYPVGTTTVTYTITDIHGNATTCSFDITVVDDEAPEVTCPSDIIISNEDNACNADVIVPAPTYDDECGIASVVNDYNGGADASDNYPVGTTTVTYTITDIHGNATTCSFDVTVIDDEAPEVTCPSNITVSNDANACSADVIVPAPVYDDECGIATVVNDYNGGADASDNYPVGTTTITYTITDIHGNATTCSFDITVIDDEAPEVTCPTDITVNNDIDACDANVSVPAPVYDDECGIATVVNDYNGGADASDNYPVGTTTVTYTITDIHGNATTCSFNITVVDNQAPYLTCPADIEVISADGICGNDVVSDQPVFSDNCGIDSYFNDYNNSQDASDYYPVGETTVVWTVIDIHGNISTCEQIITVSDIELPTISCTSDITVNNDVTLCSADIIVDAPVVADNCGIASVVNDYNNTDNASDTYPVGTTFVQWTVTDLGGNIATCTTVITVVDIDLPTIICPENIAVENDIDECGAQITVAQPFFDDNCGIATVLNDFNGSANATDFYPVGITTVTWTATDVNGNISECQMTIEVTDTQLPVITCPENIEVENDPGECGATVNYTLPTFDDNCSGSNMTLISGLPVGSLFPLGTTTVTYQVEDASGNTVDCSFDITVIDTEAPEIICPIDMSIPNMLDMCGAFVSYPVPQYTDNCTSGDAVLIEGPASGEYFEVGTTTVTYSITDDAGNTATCSFTITVNDVQAPTSVLCPNDIVTTDPIVTYELPQFIDNCGFTMSLENGLESGDVFPHGITEVTYLAIDDAGNITECTFTVLVNNPPTGVDDEVDFLEEDVSVTIDVLDNDFDIDGDEITVSNATAANGQVIINEDGSLTYINDPTVWCGTDTITYVVCDIYNACDTAIVLVNVECFIDLILPEGFSPNNDGVNDTFEIIGLEDYPNNKLSVFNRWGHKVFEAEDYQNDWDGTSQSPLTLGSGLLPKGTYFYVLDLGEGGKPVKGYVFLNR
ncbi:MAG: HYR domain-containing protein, partial [Flavobacteriales bacterium]